jgi:hypothetical protein
MTPEAQFLLDCARSMVAGSIPPQPENLDLPALLALAGKHSLEPLLQHIPAFHAATQQNACAALVLTAELLRLLALFESSQIPVVPLKGPVLAVSLYGGLASRISSDLDLLVRPPDTRRAFDLLCGAGYRLQTTLPGSPRNQPGDFPNKEDELLFDNPAAGIRVDLHWRLVPSYLPQPDEHWGNLRSLTLAGRSVAVLCDEDLLLFLCLHGAKHLWERLGWICDVAKLVQSRPELHWQRIFDQAGRARCRRFLLLGLEAANDLAGAEMPNHVAALCQADPAVKTRAQVVRDRLFLHLRSPAPGPVQIRFTLPLLETAGDKLRYLNGMALAPTEAEFRALDLPSGLHWMYYPFRLARLTWKHAAAVLLVLILAGLGYCLRHMGDFLAVNDPLESAQTVVVMGGDPEFRGAEAASLYQRGFTRHIWLTAHLEDVGTRAVFERMGVPRSAVRVFDWHEPNTAAELRAVARELQASGSKPVILVTSKYHALRVKVLWRKLARDHPHVIVRSAALDSVDTEHWWRSRETARIVWREWLGLLVAWAT